MSHRRWSHIGDTTPIARKEYECLICGEAIPKGEKHVARSGFTEDGPETFRMHNECEEFTLDFDNSDWECYSTGDITRSYIAYVKSRRET